MKMVISKKEARDILEEQEILADKDMMEQLKESKRNIKEGKTWEFKY